jgi:hypothetical protein
VRTIHSIPRFIIAGTVLGANHIGEVGSSGVGVRGRTLDFTRPSGRASVFGNSFQTRAGLGFCRFMSSSYLLAGSKTLCPTTSVEPKECPGTAACTNRRPRRGYFVESRPRRDLNDSPTSRSESSDTCYVPSAPRTIGWSPTVSDGPDKDHVGSAPSVSAARSRSDPAPPRWYSFAAQNKNQLLASKHLHWHQGDGTEKRNPYWPTASAQPRAAFPRAQNFSSSNFSPLRSMW